MTTAILITAIALTILGTIAVIVNVGKPRKPTTGGQAAATAIVNGLMIAGFVYVLIAEVRP